MRMMKRIFVVTFLIVYCFIFQGNAEVFSSQDSLSNKTEVSLSTLVEPRRVPLNRTFTFRVQVSWQGDLDLIEIGNVEEPLLTNFDIVGTSSSNRVVGTATGKKAVKEIAYTLKPKTLGMGYIEAVGLTYTDKTTGKEYHLKTQRVGVEVISPVPEKGESVKWWIWVVVGIVLLGSGGSVLLLYKKTHPTEKEEKVEEIVEESYLKELKQTVNLEQGDGREAFTILSKLFRKYLSEKYNISALEATTEELLSALKEQGLEESLIRRCETLFKKTDVVKFSGQDATQAELEEAYSTVETILESHLAQTKELIQRMEETRSKKKKQSKEDR